MRIRKLGCALLLSIPLLAGTFDKFGQPACPAPVLDKQFFVVCYNVDHKIPLWVGYSLTRDDLAHPVADRSGLDFRADTAIPKGQRAENADYSNSGYDKGHMAPAADFKRSVDAIKATFVLSNAVPQKHGANAGVWGQLEDTTRNLAVSRGDIWVFSGPALVGTRPMKSIGKNQVGVPTHTFKVVLCVHADGAKEMFAYLIPNVDKPAGKVEDYAISVNQVEKLVHLDFFDKLPADEQKRLESRVTR